MDTILETENLTKKYKEANVLNGLTMHVNKGDIYGFVGNNGAGKSTLMRIVMRLASSTSGNYKIFGISKQDLTPDVLKRVTAVIETPAFYPHLTGFQNLAIQQMSMECKVSKEKIYKALDKVGLTTVGKKKVKNYSLGMKQRLGLARALINDAELIILDEPTNGLDPSGIIQIRNIILNMNKEHGTTFIISSHHVTELQKLISKLGIIKSGKIVKEVTSDEMNREQLESGISMEEYIIKYAN